jgi:NADH-quinone oxidoreductase subunit H
LSLPATVGYYEPWWIQVLKALVIFAVALQLVPLVLIAERKLLGRMQSRYGPNRVGPFGLLQPMADILKLLTKEQFRPTTSVGVLFAIAPVVSILTAVAAFALIPFGDTQHIFGTRVGLYGVDLSIGPLYILAFGAIAFYGIMLGGWSSGSKYSFLGAMRGAAQLISYEVSQGLALLGVLFTAQTLSLTGIVHAQAGMWYVVPQLAGFLIFLTAGFAETNRAPFDLTEADAELVGGYNTEFGGGRFASYYFAEYLNVLVVSGITTTVFLGGWLLPFGLHPPGWVDPFVVLAKMSLLTFLFIWVRATLPRPRYDQLMSFGWKVLLPLATLNALVTAIVVVATHRGRDGLDARRARDRGQAHPAAGRGARDVAHFPRDAARPVHDVPSDPRGHGDCAVPRGEDARVSALSRAPQASPLRRHRSREVRGLLAVRRRLPGGLHPRRGRREHAREPRVGWRALRGGVRDQHVALHFLRLLRGRVPVRRDHDGPRLRAVGLRPLRSDLHQGDAARRAARAHASANRRGVS